MSDRIKIVCRDVMGTRDAETFVDAYPQQAVTEYVEQWIEDWHDGNAERSPFGAVVMADSETGLSSYKVERYGDSFTLMMTSWTPVKPANAESEDHGEETTFRM